VQQIIPVQARLIPCGLFIEARGEALRSHGLIQDSTYFSKVQAEAPLENKPLKK
jgi:hypothetical protein